MAHASQKETNGPQEAENRPGHDTTRARRGSRRVTLYRGELGGREGQTFPAGPRPIEGDNQAMSALEFASIVILLLIIIFRIFQEPCSPRRK